MSKKYAVGLDGWSRNLMVNDAVVGSRAVRGKRRNRSLYPEIIAQGNGSVLAQSPFVPQLSGVCLESDLEKSKQPST
jgi:hypothetical protein